MEVLVRSVKLTKSKIDQLQLASAKQILSYKPLGYIIDLLGKGRKGKRILLNDEETNHLVHAPFPKSISIMPAHGEYKPYIKVYTDQYGHYDLILDTWETTEDVQRDFEKLEQMLVDAEESGQIFY